jgi:thiamine-phosphate pyrophosphorylase
MRNVLDLSIYLVTDPGMTFRRGLVATVAAAADGGATVVQLRDKVATFDELVTQARALKSILKPRGIPLIINDRVDVALATGAAGVHLGQDDGSCESARRLLGPDAIIGQSVTTAEEIAGLDPAVVDYAGLGPIFATQSKVDAGTALGAARFAELRRLIPVPTVAIGGISIAGAGDAFAAGADGVACISAICKARDPRAATAQLAAIATQARRLRP